jgi:hypothetical protein
VDSELAEIDATPVSPGTAAGAGDGFVEPFPSWPLPFCPQHFTVALESSAHLCESPTAIDTTPERPGTTDAEVLPLPQQVTPPVAITTQVSEKPALTTAPLAVAALVATDTPTDASVETPIEPEIISAKGTTPHRNRLRTTRLRWSYE